MRPDCTITAQSAPNTGGNILPTPRKSLQSKWDTGGPGETRTPDLRFRKPLLCPSELQAQSHNGFVAHILAYCRRAVFPPPPFILLPDNRRVPPSESLHHLV